MRGLVIGLLAATLAVAGPAPAQDRAETLADVRQQLSVLHVEMQKLRRELSTTGGVGTVAAIDTTVIARVDAIESELQRLTSKTEELEFRIERIVRDGSNRLGDLEFRLCELESDCDISKLGQGTTLGGIVPGSDAGTTIGAGDPAQTGDGVQMAVGEQADFDLARTALEAGEYATAAERFERFIASYPGSPLQADAGLRQGEALERSGETAAAARAWLDTFSTAPNGPKAPEALFLLGRALGRLGQTQEACVTLSEVGVRFPGGQAAADAGAEMQALGCQ